MAVFRVHKSKDYTVLPTQFLKNKELSMKAKGLLAIMLSLPEEWDYSVIGLAALSKDGKDAVMSTLDELSTSGYVDIEMARNDKGQYESTYNIYENPNRKTRCGKSESVNPPQYNNIIKDVNNNSPHSNELEFDPLPKKKDKKEEFYERIRVEYVMTGKLSKEDARDFYDYWTETNPSGKTMRFEGERFFDLGRRIATWKKHKAQYNK